MKNFFDEFDSFFNNEFENLFNKQKNGTTKKETGKDPNSEWTRQTFISNDGLYVVTSFVKTIDTKKPKNVDLKQLKSELQLCVDRQDFEKAAELRDKIISIESNEKQLNTLKKELEKAVSEQNYEKAIEIRDIIKGLNSQKK